MRFWLDGLFAVLVLLAACTPARAPEAPRAYVYPVPTGATFDMARGRTLSEADEAAQLTGPGAPRLLFLGEQHADPRSLATHIRLIRLLLDRRRPVTVALEMFPPEADAALDAWRLGRLTESEFVAQSRWYETWGFPWLAYRDLFLLIRDAKLPAHGINADDATRAAVRENRLDSLSPAVRAEIGDLDVSIAPHRDYLADSLRSAGHDAGASLAPGGPAFQRMQRVQVLWDRLMGLRAARLAETLPHPAIVVVILGAGHVAFGLGANLQAARVSLVPQLSVWETILTPHSLRRDGMAAIPVGIANWVRVYLPDPTLPSYPRLSGVKLAVSSFGVRVDAVRVALDDPARVFQTGDIVQAIAGAPVRDPTTLRLRIEALDWDKAVTVTLLRGGAPAEVRFTPRRPSPGNP